MLFLETLNDNNAKVINVPKLFKLTSNKYIMFFINS